MKTIDGLFATIKSNSNIYQFYKNDILGKNYSEIFHLLSKLCLLNYKITSDLFLSYEQFLLGKTEIEEPEEIDENDPIVQWKLRAKRLNLVNIAFKIKKNDKITLPSFETTPEKHFQIKEEITNEESPKIFIKKSSENSVKKDEKDLQSLNENTSSSEVHEEPRDSGIRLDSMLIFNNDNNYNRIFNLENPQKTKISIRNKKQSFLEYNRKTINHIKIKNSEKLYNQVYKAIQDSYAFKGKPQAENFSLSEQLYQCYSCHIKISKGLYIIWNNAKYCHYTGYWYCANCISIEKRPIPYKAIENFDLKGYSISRESQNEIDKYYHLPILEISYFDKIVKDNQNLYDFFVIKRQLHLIYDVICDIHFLEDLLTDNIHLVLKKNLLSLKNLYEIYNNSSSFILKKYQMIRKHIDICEVCQKKGRICKICNSPEKIYIFELQKTTLCKECQRLYHLECLNKSNCTYCLYNS